MLGQPSSVQDKEACQRRDGRNLARYWQDAEPGSRLVLDTKSLMSVDVTNTSRLMGLFAAGHLPYAAVKPDEVPSLANMTLQAIRMLRKNKNGFFLMVSVRIILSHSSNFGFRYPSKYIDERCLAECVTVLEFMRAIIFEGP